MTRIKGKSLLESAGLQKVKVAPIFKEGGELIPADTGHEEDKVEGTKDHSKGAFVGKMFQMRDITHLLHLKTTSYAEHKALDEFYKGLLPFADSVAEIYQSEELLDIRVPATVLEKTSIEYISSFKKHVKMYKDKCNRDEIKNLLEEVMALCSVTVYKLKFLK